MDGHFPARAFSDASPYSTAPVAAAHAPVAVGAVLEVAGASSKVVLDAEAIETLADDSDPAIAQAGQVGAQLKMRVGTTWLIANVRAMRLAEHDSRRIVADIDFLGEGDEEKLTGKLYRFRRGVTRYPVPGTEVFPVSTFDLKQIYAADERAHIEIGHVYPTKNIRAALYVDSMLGKHFALLGSTGTGKSTAAALILHRICQLAPQGHIVMIDPHGEYGAAFKDHGAVFDVSNLAMPYWLMNFEEHCEVFLTSSGSERQVDADILAKCLLAAKAKNRLAADIPKLTVDAPIPYLLSDLSNLIQLEMGKMDKATDSAPYLRVKAKIDEIKTDPRYAFMFSGMLVSDSMASFMARIFRLPGGGQPISIIDVSGVPSEITSVVVAVLSRMVFDYAIWSRGEAQRPILLVCEEAHRYVPNERNADGSSVGRILSRIAKEGRKYGVSLGLVTQRPSDLAEGVLSQCGTILTMRLNNDRDQAFVRAAMPEGARGFLDSIPALRNRECIAVGEGVATPIRLLFDSLEADKRPASGDPVFSELWRETGGEEQSLARTISRWRSQAR
ncbi:ATP-binding protein [Stakelama tenebrarum]|uniref:ATP-binding protein n=1 Tax=Stakelama tenebrarum TaxID=2711215 RepID=A0A6G6Y9W0_9SPHN|nr:ATP-binding protein [Sphingosinithalassobacter tenebrarum]QIG81631.1 ATP-binding protein [Sphingosinithalassobacter tenebrarum]